MTEKMFTLKELAEFDRITLEASSRDQVRRIAGRLELAKFKELHGQAKCDALWEMIKQSDATP